MKHLLIILALAIVTNIHAQTADNLKVQIDSLKNRKSTLENEMATVNQGIEAKTKLLSELQNQSFDKTLTIKATKETIILDSKSVAYGKKVTSIKKGEEFTLISYESDFCFVDFKNIKGYVYYVYLNGINGVEDFEVYWTKRNAEIKKAEKQIELTEDRDRRLQRLTNEFGAGDAYKIINIKIWIGMTERMAIESIGSPDKVNRFTYTSGIHEQWVYKDKFLYFENGVLKSWQDEN